MFQDIERRRTIAPTSVLPPVEAVERETVDASGVKRVPIQWKRRLFHMGSAIIPLSVLLLGMTTAQTVALFALPVLGFVAFEFLRLRSTAVNADYLRRFGGLMRPHEREGVNSAVTMTLAVYVGAAIFGVQAMMIGFLCLSLGDPIAAIVGLKWGRTKFAGKSLEGSLACFAVCFAVASYFLPGQLGLAVAAALTATAAEAVPSQIDDNIRIPLSTAAVVFLATWLA